MEQPVLNRTNFHRTGDVMEVKVLHIQEYLHFYYLYLNKVPNDAHQKQNEQKEKKHLFLFPLWIQQHPSFHLLFPENQLTQTFLLS